MRRKSSNSAKRASRQMGKSSYSGASDISNVSGLGSGAPSGGSRRSKGSSFGGSSSSGASFGRGAAGKGSMPSGSRRSRSGVGVASSQRGSFSSDYQVVRGGKFNEAASGARTSRSRRSDAFGGGLGNVGSAGGGNAIGNVGFGSSGTQRVGSSRVESVSVGELRRSEVDERALRAQKHARNYAIRVIVVLAIVVLLVLGGGIAYNSSLFSIENVEVQGVDHLTQSEMAQLAAVPDNTTLLRVDVDTIKSRLLQNAWVQDVSIDRKFPDTLVINVTERTIAAVVAVPTSSGKSTKKWAISSDHMWLMPIPDKDSESGKNTSEKIYEDADAALKITNVPYGTEASIGSYCTDDNVLNALDIVSGMTTELAGMVTEVSASGAEETTLMLNNGVEIAFGKAENIRDKERVILQILKQNEGSVSYINVRTVSSPTWRTI